ncbi:hypothetical protein ASPSYDRAFT_593747 [Aspergillus sydowii CBS 593.65]|uniref:Mid2 domain-containing protein n=1 Tax=Aspergillus sydowii CBS 593.65 TaxID=1036612 RepID=A0A1L9TR21_9EURO|nr:uncharacterized protein ASPSYDRAFT_593747 [Aspergillus sydowii CBS 593.65]OJJ61861.1 hypothetical protein ASPSYDRAFT_593747 [Aspergillus sydowii CBS 593.65]
MRLKRPFPKPKPSVSTIRTSHLQASFAKDCTCPGSLSGLILSDLALVHQVERKAQFLPTYIKLNPFRRISSLPATSIYTDMDSAWDSDRDTEPVAIDSTMDFPTDTTTGSTETTSSTEETSPGTTTTVVTVTGSTRTSTVTYSFETSTSTSTDPTEPVTITVYQPSPTAGEGTDSASTDNVNSDTNTGGLSTGAKAGIGVGVACAVILLIAVALFLFFRRRRRGGGGKVGEDSGTRHGSDIETDKGAGVSPAEIENTERRVFELPGGRDRPELEGEGRRERERYELDGRS